MDSYTETIRKCRRNDRRAQLKFYTTFYKGVYNCSYRILGNPQEAEEVMQETFLKIFDRMADYIDEPEEVMMRILKRIAINASIDLVRKRKIQFTELNESFDHCEEPEEEDNETLQPEMIRQTMLKMPEGYRLVLNLHLLEGLEYEEIATQMQISASTVRSQYARARQKLIHLLNHSKQQVYHENIIG